MLEKLKQEKEYIRWEFDFALSTFFEINIDEIKKLVPLCFSPVETRPGCSLINMTLFNFKEGSLKGLPNFEEIIFSAVVTPDLSEDIPLFALFVLTLGSSNQTHLDHCLDYYKLPVYKELIKGSFDHSKLESIFETQNAPIVSSKCQTSPMYNNEIKYMQIFTEINGSFYKAPLFIEGDIFEHQNEDMVGEIFNHPFFRGINTFNIDPIPYLQMVTKPGHKGYETYFRPEELYI